MSSRHGREIGAFRTSGHNPRPTPPQAAQQPAGTPVRRAAPGNGVTASYVAGRAQGVLTEPTISAADHEHGVTIRIDGTRHRIPDGVEVAFGHSEGRDIAYLSRAAHDVVVLLAVEGAIRELRGIPRDVLRDLRTNHFPEVAP